MQRRLLLLGLSAAAMPALAIEEPDYTVLRTLGNPAVEVRQYAPYTVAEVIVPGPGDSAGNRAFPILAGYIFGGNQGQRKLAMTAPVSQAPVKLAMTAPVTQTAAGDGFAVQFVMPKGVTPANAPVPNDARVQLREVPARTLAVIRYSGFWSQANQDEHLAKLTAALREAGLAWTGEAVLSRYDPPITPWFLRRNELWLQLQP